MNATTLQLVLRRKPFRPFFIQMTDGEGFEIPHPEIAHLSVQTLTLADPKVDYILHFDLRLVAIIRETSDPEAPVSDTGQEPTT